MSGAQKPAWTAGPWIVRDGLASGIEIVGKSVRGKDRVVARCHGNNRKANADLLVAAADLYEALEAVVRIADRNTVEFDAARAALARARGEQ